MDELLLDDDGPIRTITLNRPKARNALSSALLAELTAAFADSDADPGIRVVILTGSDPAFCAGLDLREVGQGGLNVERASDPESSAWWVLGAMRTPVIGAINGPAITGGLELALQCSFLVASERAVFADTHARVGLHPAGGISGLLPQAVGLRYAREMSFTGRFVDAAEALRLGLVNRVVAHDALLPTVRALAGDIAESDGPTVAALNDTYRDVSLTTLAEGLALERHRGSRWAFDPAQVEARRQAVIARGRTKLT